MNKRMISYMLGRLLVFEGLLMLLPVAVGLIYKEKTILAYLITAASLIVIGFLLSLIKTKNKAIFSKEGLVTVALGWVILSLGGAVPFYISGEIPSFIDAFFETVSGFTTTGSSILTDVEALSKTSIFWRSFTHWIGGMGVIVFIIAASKMASGGGNIHLLRSESPGPEVSKLVPSSKGTAKILYLIYLVMTAVEIVLLLLCRLPLFDAVTLSFGTAGTGGFGINNSFTADGNVPAQMVIAVFMMLFGINFSCYYLLLLGKIKDFFKNEEIITYLLIMFSSVGIITFNIVDMTGSFASAFRDAFFQVSSIMTTTGYSITDFNNWPELSRMIIILIMFIGACSGSTGGGVKVIRALIFAKSGLREIKLAAKPNRVSTIRYNGKIVNEGMVRNVSAYFALYVLVFVVSLFLISFENKDIVSNTTSVIATLNNIGPGLEKVGATGNFSSYSAFSKLVFSADMLLGRLELIPLFVLFSPKSWKR